MHVADYRRVADKFLLQYHHSVQQVREEKTALACCQDQFTHAVEAQSIIQQVAQTVQQQAHHRIVGIVSKCLSTIFEEPYQFKIVFERKRGRTEARPVFVRNGEEFDPTKASGGGVVDVAAFALRLASNVFAEPPLRRVMVLDEPFKFLSVGHRPRVRAMLDMLAKELGVQFVMVTHLDDLISGNVIEL